MMEICNNEETISIQLFGNFKICQKDIVLTNDQLSDNICHLIAYLSVYRNNSYSSESIFGNLIEEDV
ncbi:MAG: hypothetical protein WBO70_04785, partial [Erysipelotrichaceae bacterium]